MFIIKRHNKRYGKKVFAEYEEARSYARKVIRKNAAKDQFFNPSNYAIVDWSYLDYCNPSIQLYGFSVAKI